MTVPDVQPAGLRSLDEYLQDLWEANGTDLLVTAGAPPLARVDGHVEPLPGERVLTGDDTAALVRDLLGDHLWERFHFEKEIDFSFGWDGIARFRANAFHQQGHAALAVRLIPARIPTFDDLGLPAIMEQFAQLPQGLVLVTGPTGSGKSTTLAAIVDRVNETRRAHILTLEDPIEYVHKHKQSVVSQREIGWDTDSFARGLRAALREDPDVVLVGEMRDPETIQIALTVAETGHLVFATLHTNDAPQAVDRMIDVFPAEQQAQVRVQLGASLQAVVAQRLVPRIRGGQVAAFEVLVATNPVRNLIREGKTHQIRNLLATGGRDGMQTMEASLTRLVADGLVSREDAVARALRPDDVR
jgi:twitching motility protein PilT